MENDHKKMWWDVKGGQRFKMTSGNCVGASLMCGFMAIYVFVCLGAYFFFQNPFMTMAAITIFKKLLRYY